LLIVYLLLEVWRFDPAARCKGASISK